MLFVPNPIFVLEEYYRAHCCEFHSCNNFQQRHFFTSSTSFTVTTSTASYVLQGSHYEARYSDTFRNLSRPNCNYDTDKLRIVDIQSHGDTLSNTHGHMNHKLILLRIQDYRKKSRSCKRTFS